MRALVVAQERLAHSRVFFDQRPRLWGNFLEANAEARWKIVTQFVLCVFDRAKDAARGARGEGKCELDGGTQRGRLFISGDEHAAHRTDVVARDWAEEVGFGMVDQ